MKKLVRGGVTVTRLATLPTPRPKPGPEAPNPPPMNPFPSPPDPPPPIPPSEPGRKCGQGSELSTCGH